MLEYILLVLVVLLCLFVWWLKEPSNNIPILPGRLPVIGHAWKFIGDSKYIMKRLQQVAEETAKQGGVTKVYLGPKVIYAVTDIDDCATVLINCLEKPFFYDFLMPLFGEESVFSSKISVWKQQRKALNPAFNLQSLYKFMDVFNDQGRRLVQQLGAHGPGPFDHFHTILLNNLETSMQTIVGYDIDELGDKCEIYLKSVEKVLEIICKRMCRVWLHNDFIYNFSRSKKQQDEHMEFIHDVIGKALDRKILQRKLNNFVMEGKSQTRNCILDYILDEGSSQFQTYKQIRDNLDILIVASYDTTATTFTYIMTIVGSYPDVQQKIYDEISVVIGDKHNITKDDLIRLIYLEAVIKESIRMCSITSVLGRKTLEATKLSKTYAMMSMKTSLVHVLRHYKVTADITKTEHKVDIMMKPASGHHIILEERK